MKKSILLSAFLLCTVWISYGQWSYTNLSEPKSRMGSCSMDSKAFFAGGFNGTNVLAAVECYDAEAGTWDSLGELSVAREFPTGVACGTKVLFAGGMKWEGQVTYNTIDIYDTETQQWEVKQLSSPKFDVSAVSYGTKVLFAGGFTFPFNTFISVDIYDVETGNWTDAMLSQSRGGMACAVVGDLAIFAGGFANSSTAVSDRVDIYNFTDNTWSTASLSQARAYASATTVGDKVVIAGGVTSMNQPTDTVDIYYASDNSWTTSSISQARAWKGNAVSLNGKAWFAGGGNFNYGFYDPVDLIDIYDVASGSWSEDVLFEAVINNSAMGIGDYVIIAGGETVDNSFTALVEIFHDPTAFIPENEDQMTVNVYPNPAGQIVAISVEDGVIIRELSIYDQKGQTVHRGRPDNNTLDVSMLQPGVYILEAIIDRYPVREKLIIY